MSRDVRLYLEDILTFAKRALDYTAGLSLEQYVTAIQVQDSVLRNLELIGEAAKHVPEALRARYPEVPWREMARFRDVLAH